MTKALSKGSNAEIHARGYTDAELAEALTLQPQPLSGAHAAEVHALFTKLFGRSPSGVGASSISM